MSYLELNMSLLTLKVLLFNVVLVIGSQKAEVFETPLDYLQSVNVARQEAIREACKSHMSQYDMEYIPRGYFNNIIVDHKHKFLYCYIPKVACTNWKRVLMILTDKWNSTDPVSIPADLPHRPRMFARLSHYSQYSREYMLQNYEKMVLVRNPFERVLSAYRSKLVGNSGTAREFQNRVGRRIVRYFRENPTNYSLRYGNDVTFTEFTKFLTERPEELSHIVNNEHWRPMTELCHPCIVNYTLVGKYETIMDDARLTLHKINASHIQFPLKPRPSPTRGLLPYYFSQLDRTLVRRLRDVYKNDFEIFNYTIDNIGPFDMGHEMSILN